MKNADETALEWVGLISCFEWILISYLFSRLYHILYIGVWGGCCRMPFPVLCCITLFCNTRRAVGFVQMIC